MSTRPLFEINPSLDSEAIARRFADQRRVQIRNILTSETAREVREVLGRGTPWGLAWHAGSDGPHGLRAEEVAEMAASTRAKIGAEIERAAAAGEYAFAYAQYRILDAYLEKWAPDGVHDLLLEYINSEPFLDLVRKVTGFPDLIKADAQATLYGPGHFLSMHNDSHVAEGWKVAYVLNLGPDEWKPDWGGYLLFFDSDGDVIQGFRPRFNSLNLFAVPQDHSVSYVPPFAPVGRFALTGWFRNR